MTTNVPTGRPADSEELPAAVPPYTANGAGPSVDPPPVEAGPGGGPTRSAGRSGVDRS